MRRILISLELNSYAYTSTARTAHSDRFLDGNSTIWWFIAFFFFLSSPTLASKRLTACQNGQNAWFRCVNETENIRTLNTSNLLCSHIISVKYGKTVLWPKKKFKSSSAKFKKKIGFDERTTSARILLLQLEIFRITYVFSYHYCDVVK